MRPPGQWNPVHRSSPLWRDELTLHEVEEKRIEHVRSVRSTVSSESERLISFKRLYFCLSMIFQWCTQSWFGLVCFFFCGVWRLSFLLYSHRCAAGLYNFGQPFSLYLRLYCVIFVDKTFQRFQGNAQWSEYFRVQVPRIKLLPIKKTGHREFERWNQRSIFPTSNIIERHFSDYSNLTDTINCTQIWANHIQTQTEVKKKYRDKNSDTREKINQLRNEALQAEMRRFLHKKIR